MLIVRLIITAILFIPAFLLALRYNIHMFQLNGYKNNEQRSWLKKNMRKQWILIFSFVLGMVRIFFPLLALDILIWITLQLVYLVFRAHKRLNTKKKLVYTARVKRLITTLVIVLVAGLAAACIFLDFECIPGVLMVILSTLFWMNIVANLINRPIEKAVNRHYINDAKRKLKSVDGIKVIGITGSYGKTSVKFYLQTLLQSKFDTLVTPESYNTPMGVVKTLRGSLKPTHEIFVCEMGARYVGDIKEICDIVHPDMGVITSIGPQHLETFGDMAHIQSTKFELADALPKGGKLFLNGDNDYIQEKAVNYYDKVFYYSEKKGEGYTSEIVSVSQYGTEFTVTAPNGEKETFRMRLIGAHNVINVVGAISVANTLGIALKDLIVPVRRIQPVEHRMQMRPHGEVTIIDDAYNSNPVGSKAAVETLKMFDGSRILVTPGMVELGSKEEEYNYKFGTYAADCCDHIVLVGKEDHIAPIRKGALDGGFPENKLKSFAKLEEALEYAYKIKDEGHKYILLENDLPDNY